MSGPRNTYAKQRYGKTYKALRVSDRYEVDYWVKEELWTAELESLAEEMRATGRAHIAAVKEVAEIGQVFDPIRRRALLEIIEEQRGLADGSELNPRARMNAPGAGSRQAVDAIVYGARSYPKPWMEIASQTEIDIGTNTRGYHARRYDSNTRKWYSEIVVSPDVSLSTRTKNLVECAIHELGHFMQSVIPGLKEAEQAFYWDRVGDEMVSVIYGSEYGRKDRFFSHYAGKQYGSTVTASHSGEIFTVGVQALFGDSFYSSYIDEDWTDWIIGLFLTL